MPPETPAAMPPSVPEGLRLELARAKVLPGQEDLAREWMAMLNERYDECVDTLVVERSVFEAWFLHREGSQWWIFHVGLTGTDGAPFDPDSELDRDHLAYAMRVKEKGWEQLEPMFMLTPHHIRETLTHWGRTGEA